MPTRAQLDEAWQVVQLERAGLGTKLEMVWVLPDYHEQYPKPCMGGWARAYMTVTPAGEVWPCHRSEEHTSELQSQSNLVCRLLLEKKKNTFSTKPVTTRTISKAITTAHTLAAY